MIIARLAGIAVPPALYVVVEIAFRTHLPATGFWYLLLGAGAAFSLLTPRRFLYLSLLRDGEEVYFPLEAETRISLAPRNDI